MPSQDLAVSASLVALLLLSGCSGSGGTIETQCTANYAVFYRDRIEFGHGAFDGASSAPHYFDLTRDGSATFAGTLQQSSFSSAGESSPYLLSWRTAGTVHWADLVPSRLDSEGPEAAQSLSLDRQGSAPLPPASPAFRTAPGISGGVWVQNAGTVEVSGWSDGIRQVVSTHPIASDIEAMNVGPTDRGPREVALGYGDAIIATTGLESLDIAQRQVVFAPSLRPFEAFSFVDLTVSSDTGCNKASFTDILNNRPNAPILEGVAYVTAVISHVSGVPDTDTRLAAKEVRVFARHASSTSWREVFEVNVPDVVTSAAVVASRNRGYLLVGTSIGLHGEPFRLNLDSAGEITSLELMNIMPDEFVDKLSRPPIAGDNRLPAPLSGSSYVVKVDSVMTERGPVRVTSPGPGNLTPAPGLR